MKNYARIKREFNQKGFAVIKNFISKKLIDEIKNEKGLAKFNKVKYCVATSGCTSALHLAIKSKRKTLKFRTNNQFLLIHTIS